MKRYKGYVFKQAVTELLLKTAKFIGVKIGSVTWDSSTQTAGISASFHVVLADVADDAVLTEVDLLRYVGFALHELLHALYTDFSVRGDTVYLDQLHNAVEDAWIEHTGIKKAMTGNIKHVLTVLVDSMVERALTQVSDWSDPRQYPFTFAVYLRQHCNKHVPVPDQLKPIIREARVRVLNCKSSNDTLALARWILSQLQALPQNPNPKPEQGKDQGKGQGEEKGKGQDKANDKGQDEGDGQGDGQDEGQGQGDPLDNAEDAGNATRPATLDEAMSAEPTNHAPNGAEGQGNYNEKSGVTSTHTGSNAWIKESPVVPARLRYEVKRLFDNSGLDEYQRNRKSGSINVSALHKFSISDKLFQRRHEVDGIDSAVVICLDVSSSMFTDGKKHATYKFQGYPMSNRIVQASLTAQALIDTLQKAQVQTCVLSFGDKTAIVKPFGQHPLRSASSFRSMDHGGGTNDYFAVRYAHKLLLNRSEERKICIVITDGQGDSSSVRKQVQIGDRLGVTTIGIGIELDVSGVYKQAVNIKNANDLAVVSFKQIKLAV